MNIYLLDEAYKKRVKRFIQLNYGLSQKIRLLDDLAELDSSFSSRLLTDDVTLERSDVELHYIVESVDQRPNYYFKYQNFRHLMEQLVGNLTASDDVALTRIIAITSLVGGVGKSTVARQIAKQLSKSRPCLLLTLLQPQTSSKQTLSEFVVTQRHNKQFDLTNYVTKRDGIAELAGFFRAEELSDSVLKSVFSSVRQLFAKSPYREIIIDAPPLPYCQTLPDYVDYTYLISDAQRHAEEQNISSALQLPIAHWQTIVNRVVQPTARSLPDIIQMTDYQQALCNILIEDGLYEY